MVHNKAPVVLSHWCIWHVGTTQDSEDTIHPPCDECGSQSNHRMPSLSHLVTDRRLRLFGHISRSSPQEDHHRAVAAVIRGLPPDWKRPSHTWVQWRQILANRTSALHLPGGRQLFVTTGGALWTQQRSSGVCYKRRKNIGMTVSKIDRGRSLEGWAHNEIDY